MYIIGSNTILALYTNDERPRKTVRTRYDMEKSLWGFRLGVFSNRIIFFSLLYKFEMYSILFHVSGIAILEICFYFYYIGPMETVIFTDKVERLAKEPLDMIQSPPTTPIPTISTTIINSLPFFDNNISIVETSRTNDTVTEDEDNFLESLKKDRDNAINKRAKKNRKLFVKILEYWIGLVFFTFLLYLMIKSYKEAEKLKKRNGIVHVPSTERDEESLELVDVNTYRRSSIDDEHLEATVSKNGKYMKFLQKSGHYVLFGGCIICFQYLFFKYVVLQYDPLSIQEVKYIIYKNLYPKLQEWEEFLNL